MYHPEAWRSLKYSLVCLTVLLLAGCGVTDNDPLSPQSPFYPVFSLRFINQPVEEQLQGGLSCKDVTLLPEKSVRLSLKFAKMDFPARAVAVPTVIEACVDRSIYAVTFSPDKMNFQLPVEAEFRLKKKDFSEDELERIRVVVVSSNRESEVIPHTLDVKKENVLVHFSFTHFSRYALVMD